MSEKPPRGLSADEIDAQLWAALADLQKSIDRVHDRTLSAEELTALREMLEAERRMRWMWATARTWAVWITAVVAGYTVGIDALKAILKRLVA